MMSDDEEQRSEQIVSDAIKKFDRGNAIPSDLLGLIDKIGYLSDAVKEAKQLAGLAGDARVVLYRRAEHPDDNLYSIAGVATEDSRLSLINIELPESLNLSTGFYYIWPGAIGGDR